MTFRYGQKYEEKKLSKNYSIQNSQKFTILMQKKYSNFEFSIKKKKRCPCIRYLVEKKCHRKNLDVERKRK